MHVYKYVNTIIVILHETSKHLTHSDIQTFLHIYMEDLPIWTPSAMQTIIQVLTRLSSQTAIFIVPPTLYYMLHLHPLFSKFLIAIEKSTETSKAKNFQRKKGDVGMMLTCRTGKETRCM